MRRLELTLSGRHICHPEHLLTYKLRYKDCGYGMFLLDTRTGYWYPTPKPLRIIKPQGPIRQKEPFIVRHTARITKNRRLYTNECIFNEIKRILQAKSILVARATKIELT